MRPVQQDGIAALSEKDRMAMLRQHIPYRKRLLIDGVSQGGAKCWQDSQAAEAGIVSGRILLSFLGLGYDKATDGLALDRMHRPKGGPTDDVKAPDVGGRFAELDELSPEEAETLARFIHGAHKACAHFTINSGHALTLDTYDRAVPIICRLLDPCVPKNACHAHTRTHQALQGHLVPAVHEDCGGVEKFQQRVEAAYRQQLAKMPPMSES